MGVSDPKLGNSIVEQTSIPCVCNDHIGEIVRGCRMHFKRFLTALKEGDYEKAQLGLAHSYSRAKVGSTCRFNPRLNPRLKARLVSALEAVLKLEYDEML